ncbi:MAG: hypothetical protein BGN84_08375 [Afipia sp. 62-7]|nr:porin family protein [Afipia sp.]OJU15220.1 MAG: hypothetical protein BGN84_08375 [Afipia sp. 62-7]
MKAFLLAGTAIVAFATAASAADLAPRSFVKAPAATARTHNWTGCYAGGHVGAGWSKTNVTDVPGVMSVNGAFDIEGDTSVLGGVQLGCDYQFANAWVVGLAGDFSGTNIKGTVDDPFFGNKNPGPAQIHTRTDWLASLSGRVGYAWDNVLLYGKGGVGFAHDRYSLSNFTATGGGFCQSGGFVACNPAGSFNRVGWVAGAGIEWAFASNWSAFIEYVHYGFDQKTLSISDPNAVGPTPLRVRQDIDVVKVGVNYRFTAGSIVARY